MNYKILEVHAILGPDYSLVELVVLVADGTCVRGAYINRNAMSGYRTLTDNDKQLSPELLQEVAGYGVSLDTARKKKYFPKVKNWYN